jgi:cytochrome c oxidase subunit 2
MKLVVGGGHAVASGPALTDQAADLDRVWSLFFWIAVGVGVLVAALMGWVIGRYRRRGRAELPAQKHQNIPLEALYTIIPLGLVIGLFAVTLVSIDAVSQAPAEPDLVVKVTGFRWQWQFDYPDSGARSSATADRPPELVLPASSTVRFELTSLDLVHSFWVPGFRFKRDVFPDKTSTFQVTVSDSTGSYPGTGVCAEFCGLDHHKMVFDVRIVPRAEFDDWTAAHQANPTAVQGGSS